VSGFKVVVFWIFVIAALALGVYSYFELKNNKKPTVQALSVLPDNCILYLNSSDFYELNRKINSQSLVADRLKLFDETKELFNSLQNLDSLLNSASVLNDELKNTLIHFALYDKNNWLIAFNIKELGKQQEISNNFVQLFNAKISGTGQKFFTLDKNKIIYYAFQDGVVIFSNNQKLKDNALNYNLPKLESNVQYTKFQAQLAENNLLSVYVNHALYSKSSSASKLNLSLFSRKGHSAGAVDVEPSELKINGYILPDSSELISAFLNQKPQKTDALFDCLPYSTLTFEAYGFDNYSLLHQNSSPHDKNTTATFWEKVNTLALYNVQTQFEENISEHLIAFENGLDAGKIITIQIIDTLNAAESLKFMSDTILTRDSTNVYRLHSTESGISLFEPLVHSTQKYVSRFGNHLYFSKEATTLFNLILALNKNSRINNNESFRNYRSQHFLDKFNYLLYTSPSQIRYSGGPFFNFKSEAREESFKNFKHCSYTLSNDNRMFKFRFHLLHETENKQKDMLWTLNLDTTASMSACTFKNHLTMENEILIQDDAHTMYLINAKGSILWKKKLSEKILSPIYIVDTYKNNKYQMLFNTESAIHLVDRNGHDVENFPINLPSKSSSPLSVFDYENTKDYRVFVACKNKNIYNYALTGKKQEGFNTVQTDYEVNLAIQYAPVGDSQYLVAVDTEGKIYTFSRRGVGRIGLKNRTVANCKEFYIDAAASINNTHLIYIDDKDGLINKISFSDVKTISKLHAEIENSKVTFTSVDENRSTDVLVSYDKKVQAFDFSGNLLLEKEMPLAIASSGTYMDESLSLLYALSRDENSLWIYDIFNQTEKKVNATSLPLISDLFKDNKKYMIITNVKKLNCLSLN